MAAQNHPSTIELEPGSSHENPAYKAPVELTPEQYAQQQQDNKERVDGLYGQPDLTLKESLDTPVLAERYRSDNPEKEALAEVMEHYSDGVSAETTDRQAAMVTSETQANLNGKLSAQGLSGGELLSRGDVDARLSVEVQEDAFRHGHIENPAVVSNDGAIEVARALTAERILKSVEQGSNLETLESMDEQSLAKVINLTDRLKEKYGTIDRASNEDLARIGKIIELGTKVKPESETVIEIDENGEIEIKDYDKEARDMVEKLCAGDESPLRQLTPVTAATIQSRFATYERSDDEVEKPIVESDEKENLVAIIDRDLHRQRDQQAAA